MIQQATQEHVSMNQGISHRSTEAIEAFLVATWRELLETDDIQTESDFFDLGGTSLTAIKLLARVEAVYGENALSPEALFSTGQLGQLVVEIATSAGAS
ncbi:acyl carrier protein [Haliangium sp.]|uniref:acyl carrier protein n=1 Tax=Haliangium sp. TaxID=2663208 RepID=UPI003D120EC3